MCVEEGDRGWRMVRSARLFSPALQPPIERWPVTKAVGYVLYKHLARGRTLTHSLVCVRAKRGPPQTPPLSAALCWCLSTVWAQPVPLWQHSVSD